MPLNDGAPANRQHNRGAIHHSDRGIQYCCPDYSESVSKKQQNDF